MIPLHAVTHNFHVCAYCRKCSISIPPDVGSAQHLLLPKYIWFLVFSAGVVLHRVLRAVG